MKTLMVLYNGEGPLLGEANTGFYINGFQLYEPLVKIDDNKEVKIANEAPIADRVIRVTGSTFFTRNLEIGIMPGACFAIWGLDDETALRLLRGINDFMITEIDYATFRNVLERASKNADEVACNLGEQVEHAYFSFFGIDPDRFKPEDQIQIVAWSKCVFNIDRIVAATELESTLLAATMIEELAKELGVERYTIQIFLLIDDKNGSPEKVLFYENVFEKPTTNQAGH